MIKTYGDYFGIKLGDQKKPFPSDVCCKTCVENLRDWKNGKRKNMPFAIPMVWKGRNGHITYFYVCMINLKGINHKNKHHVQYPDVPSAIRPILHCSDVSVSGPDGNMEYSSDSKHRDMTVVAGHDARRGRPASILDIIRTQ